MVNAHNADQDIALEADLIYVLIHFVVDFNLENVSCAIKIFFILKYRIITSFADDLILMKLITYNIHP